MILVTFYEKLFAKYNFYPTGMERLYVKMGSSWLRWYKVYYITLWETFCSRCLFHWQVLVLKKNEKKTKYLLYCLYWIARQRTVIKSKIFCVNIEVLLQNDVLGFNWVWFRKEGHNTFFLALSSTGKGGGYPLFKINRVLTLT